MIRSLFFALFSLCILTGWSQEADSTSLAADSVSRKIQSLTQQLETYERLLLQNNQKRQQDSLARVELMKSLQLLRENEKLTEVTLREQIAEIEKRDSVRNQERKNRILELKQNNQGYLVAPYGDSLFLIYTKLGPVMPQDRAKSIEEKLSLLVRDDVFYKDSVRTEIHEGTVDIMYGNLIVTSVSEWDALWMEGESNESLAEIYKEKIREYVSSKRNRSTVQNMAARIGLVFLVIGGVVLILYFLGRLANGIQGWIIVNKNQFFTGIRIRSYELLPPKLHLEMGVRFIGLLKWALYILIIYLSLPLIFGLFPFTRGWANTLLGWVLSPAKNVWFGFWNYLPNIFTIAVIAIITHYLVRFIRFLASEIELGHLNVPGFYSDWAMPTYRLVRFLIYAFMLVVIWPYLPNSSSDVFKGVSVFIGLLISLGSSSAISNAVAGLVITYMRPFRVGDRVKIGEVTGEVIEKTLLVTRVRTTKNEDITVPNSSILSGHTVNYTTNSRELGLVLHTGITIGYDVPWRKVHELLIEAAVETDGINISKEPFVLQTSLDDWYVSYQLNGYTDTPERMPQVYSELHAKIQDKFNEAGIEIMSPHYRAVRDGNHSTIPPDHKQV